MKKIFTISVLAALTGCMSTPQTQAPVETINQSNAQQTMKPIDTVAEVDPSVVSEPLYLSSESVAISEKQLPTETTPSVEPTATETANTQTTAIEPEQNVAQADNSEVQEANDMVDIVGEDHQVSAQRVAENTQNKNVVEATPEVTATAATTAEQAPEKTVESTPELEAVNEQATEVTPNTQPIDETQNAVDKETTTEETAVGEKTTAVKGFSIQLLAMRETNEFKPYLSQLPADQPAWLNDKMINGSSVYTLLYGHYNDYETAKAALEAMPQKVVQSGAFVRNLADIEATQYPTLQRIR
ncbi:SPOR domain-containing protein [Photobacterium angustum]|uniref:SPOR domain-containing protein n=1 Tax=Photobacterium angustum TaxID=661 RepID=UPI0005E2858E|nr:SPOR domain-containing protein [Photobacterium angustum]KJG17665.1 sporulation protein [Photobacterium angustum]KJG24869.1 sporulation protein [Photobacterium angustum]KJG32998.1 sporulation protein [Photobacterium angustum]PSW97622.1 SPOR domain-containing protein [Photobacterium angustum]PSX01522.1 SPOR domain-containing protein [Photobacterium angustum]